MEETKQDINEVIQEVTKNYEPEVISRTMTMSESIGDFAGAMAKAQGSMQKASKDKKGYGYTYMTLNNLIEVIKEPLATNDLAFIQTHELVKGANPSVITDTIMMHSSGQWIKSQFEIPIAIMKQLSAAQMAGVAATYGRRYSLQAMTGIAADEDTDGIKK